MRYCPDCYAERDSQTPPWTSWRCMKCWKLYVAGDDKKRYAADVAEQRRRRAKNSCRVSARAAIQAIQEDL